MNFRGPNPCCILTLDAMFVSCHCLMFFLTATNKTYFQNYIVCIVCISLYPSYLIPKPLYPTDETPPRRIRYHTSPYTRRINATTVEDSKNMKTRKNSKIYMTFRRPNPCCILTLDAMICELSYFVCVFRQQQIKPFTKIYCLYCVYLSLSLSRISSQNPWTQ